MAEVEINLTGIKQNGTELAGIYEQIIDMERKVREISNALNEKNFADVKRCLNATADEIKGEAEKCREYRNTLFEIAGLYQKTEKRIVKSMGKVHKVKESAQKSSEEKERGFLEKIKDMWKRWTGDRNVEPYEIDSIVFDEDEEYGGDQGAPKGKSVKLKGKLLEIILANNPESEMDEQLLKHYLRKLNSEGCGYVALTNTILTHFEGREEEFEEAFGYSMYDENGNVNYDMLLVDLYSSWDNIPDGEDEVDEWNDYDEDDDGDRDDYDYWNDESGSGTSQYERAHYLENFMEEHGVEAEVETDVKVDIYNYDDIAESGKSVIVAFRNGNLYNEDGTVAQKIEGGHAMSVTGVTSDGRMIVSSWGEKYYIDPYEDANLYYNDEYHETSMTFSTIEFE